MKFTIFFLTLFFSFNCFSQELVDKVYLKDKTIISGKIIRVTAKNIEINPKGKKPFLLINRNNVVAIIYSDNTVVSFENENNENNKSVNHENKTDIPDDKNSGTFTDIRDGEVYNIGRYGNQIWMLENLRYVNANISYHYPNGNQENVIEYGVLYEFDNTENICPEGWKLPSRRDWTELFNQFDGLTRKTSKALRSNYGYARFGLRGKGNNSSGFNAPGAGYWTSLYNRKIDYLSWREGAYYWTNKGNWFYIGPSMEIKLQTKPWSGQKERAHSCRCIKD